MTLAPKAQIANNLQYFFGKTSLVWRVSAAGLPVASMSQILKYYYKNDDFRFLK